MSEETKDVQETTEEVVEEVAEETAEAVEAAAEEAPAEEAPAEEAKSSSKADRTYEVSFESLGLTKTLDKMTAKELRQLAMEKIPAIVGASSMSKEDLVARIKELFDISDEDGSVSPYKDQILGLKREIRDLRAAKEQADGRKERDVLRRKINKLKKRTRRLANAV